MNQSELDPQSLYPYTKRKTSNGDGAINFRPDCKKWRVRVTVGGKRRTVGTFTKKDDAEACLASYIESLPEPKIDRDLERRIKEIESDGTVRCIRTTKGQFAVVGIDDFPLLSQLKWQAYWSDHTQSYYPKCAWHDPTRKSRQRHISMSRLIMGVVDDPSVWVDHINHDTMNHRRNNLRLANAKQSARNRRIRRAQGLKWTTPASNGRWIAQVTVDEKRIYLGQYDTAEEAHEVSKTVMLKSHAEFVCSETIIEGEPK
jgi:hypothetical protein